MSGPFQRFKVLLQLALWSLLFYSVARGEFFFWNYGKWAHQSFSDILAAFALGLRFDLAAIFILMAPLVVWTLIPWPASFEKAWKTVVGLGFVILQTPLLILNLVDTEFINFVGRRFTYDSLFLAQEVSGKFWEFVGTYWHLFLLNSVLILIFLIGAMGILWRQPLPTWAFRSLKGKAGLQFLGAAFLSLILSVIAIRGGLQNKPMDIVNANVFTHPMMNNLVLNTSFTFIKSYGVKELPKVNFFSEGQELSLLNGSMQGSLWKASNSGDRQNVVIIILESFGSEYLGERDGVSFTPFLDQLKKKSLSFKNSFANGRRSIEGVAAILSSVPALMTEPYISSHFASNAIVGLGTELHAQGYHTSFFHGGRNGTMHFDSFMPSVGINHYFGATEYANAADDDGVWGIWDQPFLQRMIQELAETPQPFLASVFTLSSHHPFKVPAQYEGQFPEGALPILKTVSYTDMALKEFFESAQKQDWYKNTLFILTADHTSLHYLKEYENEWGNYHVPLWLFHPSKTLPQIAEDQVVQHIDIPATVLDFLGILPTQENLLGSSMFVPGDKVVVNYNDGRYILFAKDYQLYWWPQEDSAKMFSMSDVSVSSEILDTQASDEQKRRKQELFDRLKAVVQYYNEGMNENKLFRIPTQSH